MTEAQTSTVDAPSIGRPLLLQLLNKTKLYWGLAALIVFGALTSPLSSKGNNIFLSLGNLTDILRQVSVTGIVAVGMTLVIFIAGIDLSVGSIMALGTVICAMLLTQQGWTAASFFAVPATGVVLFIAVIALLYFVQVQLRKTKQEGDVPAPSKMPAIAVGAVVALSTMFWMMSQVDSKFGVMAVLIAVPCVGIVMGSLNGR